MWRADFDRIAAFDASDRDVNALFHSALLARVPARCGLALDVGCGAGAFSRRLASRADRVIGLDLSPNMIALARQRSAGISNLEYRVADVMTEELGGARFDCVASIATLHHLPLDTAFARLASALRPRGRLLVMDLLNESGAPGWVRSAVSRLALETVLRSRRGDTGRKAREAWDAHDRHDRWPGFREVRAAAARALPGARLRRHLMWRWSLVWERPE